MKLLYIGKQIIKTTSGADQINKRNQQLLTNIFRGEIAYVEPIGDSPLDKLVLGVNKQMISLVKKELEKGSYTHVFISQSIMGRIIKIIKKQYPSIEIINFFHNIEVQYAYEYFKTYGFKALPFFLTVKFWEHIGCTYSDKFITLNNRDSILLKDIYGKISTIELPTSFDDKFDNQKASSVEKDIKLEPIDYLFVGVAFFANIHGVQWFIDNVMPQLNGEFYIIGKGMDTVPFKNLTPNIHIHGFVDDLDSFYYRAKMVVSPIFVGGGMKTKTAEALMYGKTIVGTEETFVGYELDNQCMHKCTTPTEFVHTILSLENSPKLNLHSRDLFNKNYSTQTALRKLKSIFYEL